ncbi:hypothetical protein Y032_0049g1840 [Ancylostoma ceylanicum]|uniref:Uncharacterized protein n=1 Tax=Ancylostoma ceylanicum TaxID=53326 RepID=A0A016U9Q1_9BILA|nr:hypothetical protein Y032_0049g1840 [Ancylostoma ceylanicum]
MLARSVSRLAVLSRRGFAAAAAATPQKNTEELRLTFASPDTIGRLVNYLIQLQVWSPVGNKLYYDHRLIESQQ